MNKLNRVAFSEVYTTTLEEVLNFWNDEMQHHISKHNVLWNVENFDFKEYLKCSEERFYRAYLNIPDKAKVVCDIGGFFGIFPVVLQKIGFTVNMTESLKYYSSAFDDLFAYISSNGVNIIDVDPFEPDALIKYSFDAITCLAVIEHYPHSLKVFIDNILQSVRPKGGIIIESPNIAYLPNRIKFIKGKSILVDAQAIYNSGVPFIGHHHEYSSEELSNLLQCVGCNIMNIETYNYSNNYCSWKYWLRNPLKSALFYIFPKTRECILVSCNYDKAE